MGKSKGQGGGSSKGKSNKKAADTEGKFAFNYFRAHLKWFN